jgi:hypothetical protein
VRISVLLFPCGTGGFLLAALDFVIDNYDMDKDQKKHLKSALCVAGNWFPIRQGWKEH